MKRRITCWIVLVAGAFSLASPGCARPSSEEVARPPGGTTGSAQEEVSPQVVRNNGASSGDVESGPHDEILLAGVIRSVDHDSIRVQSDAQTLYLAKEMTFQLTEETEITIGGAPAKREDLTPQMQVTVTPNRKKDMPVAVRIDATRVSE